ncbi:hypothetical protein JW813_06815 [Clostridium botulinum]|nr:hypothetical protein [Clostridium botulinum]UZP04716.1 hypothetical protein JW813_06815 [Clostridium botulinum]UZP08128.1 hypothetical protein JYA71_07090 [Clostridium botulinum]UZP11455.1 hypothetical protein JYA74_06810 [Clostridium botulinum]
MNILLILKIIAVVLQLIASGISESEAVSQASAKFGVAESLIRKFL